MGQRDQPLLQRYDGLDHFTQWNAGSNNFEQYIYDASGQRVLRRSTNGSGTTMTVYAFGLEDHSYSSSGSNTGNTYYYSLAGRLLGKSDGTNTTFYLVDGLGTPQASFSNVANSAALKGNQVYGPYGKQRYHQGTIGTPKGFTGQYNDSLTGLDYYNARYYDPVAGVFLSADTKQGNPQGMNPYAYANGNPETHNDPTGHDASYDPYLVYIYQFYMALHPDDFVTYDSGPDDPDRITLDRSAVPKGNPDLWYKLYARGNGNYGVPDIINFNLDVIWEVKSGLGIPKDFSTLGQNWPAPGTIKIGNATANWYVARANALDYAGALSGGEGWHVPGEWYDTLMMVFVNDECGGTCYVPFTNGLVLGIRTPIDGLITYRVMENPTGNRKDVSIDQSFYLQYRNFMTNFINRYTRLVNENSDGMDTLNSGLPDGSNSYYPSPGETDSSGGGFVEAEGASCGASGCR